MKTTPKRKKSILPFSDNHLLSLKQLMDKILHETDNLPADVKEAVIQARDKAWQAFIAEQETTMTK